MTTPVIALLLKQIGYLQGMVKSFALHSRANPLGATGHSAHRAGWCRQHGSRYGPRIVEHVDVLADQGACERRVSQQVNGLVILQSEHMRNLTQLPHREDQIKMVV